MTLRIKADVRKMAMVAPFVSKDKTRHSLRGIYIEKHKKCGIVMTATDGHRLASVYDKSGSITGAKSAIIEIPKTLKPHLNRAAREFHQIGNASYITTALEKFPEKMGKMVACACNNVPNDGTFPDWRKVVPKASTLKATKSIAFNHRYIDGFLRVLGKNACVTAHFTDEFSPTIFRCSAEPDFLGVLMPMRSGVSGAYPEWYIEP